MDWFGRDRLGPPEHRILPGEGLTRTVLAVGEPARDHGQRLSERAARTSTVCSPSLGAGRRSSQGVVLNW